MKHIEKKTVWLILGALVTAAVILTMVLRTGKKMMIVSKDIQKSQITEFYWTYSTSTNPPEYQRYYFYAQDGKTYFYHETREGDGWPLSEEDITVCGTLELSEGQWQEFFDAIAGGTVISREESTESGDSGPWTYLYWQKDKGKYQQYEFVSRQASLDFKAFCEGLKEEETKKNETSGRQG